MSFSLGIIGLPNVGKSTLFNALSTARANVSNYPFCTIDPNVAVVAVPDERLKKVQAFARSPKAIPAAIKFIDIAGLVKGAHKGEGLGNKFLSHVREATALVHVVRCFADENIVHVDGSVDPQRDVEIINLEFVMADLAAVENRLQKTKIAAKAGGKASLAQIAMLEKAKTNLEKGIPLRLVPAAAKEVALQAPDLKLLTLKPVIYVANVAEEGSSAEAQKIRAVAEREKAVMVAISSKIEAEINELLPKDQVDFCREAGIQINGLRQLIRAGYKLLRLITFYTANNKECRAWALPVGTAAPAAAGKIHSDLEKGFIAAEVIHYADLLACASLAVCREKGKLYTAGKDYQVRDGDLVYVKFSV